MASIMKASLVIAVDLDQDKLEFSKKFGATHIINAKKANPIEEIMDITNGGVDYAFDAIGKEITMKQILMATKKGGSGSDNKGGTSVLIGIPEKNEIEIEANEFIFFQKTYMGSLGATYPEKDFPYFLDMYHKGKFPINEMITETFSLNEINEACNKLKNGQISGRSIIKY